MDDVEEIDQAAIADKRAAETMVARTVRRLIDLSLGSVEGAHLGSQNDLLTQFGVSRPTLRQAAKVVESGRLITVRRGVNGGVFASRPVAADAVQAPALFLRLQNIDIVHAHDTVRLLLTHAAGLAATCEDAALRARLAAFGAQVARRAATPETPAEAAETETAIAKLMAEMSGNPALQLFIDILFTFGPFTRWSPLRDMPAADQNERRRLLWHLCDAILTRDAAAAADICGRRSDLAARSLRAGATGGPEGTCQNGG